MIKKHLKLLIITSIIIILPVFAGLILWDRLPEQMPTHWNAVGEVDRWGSKAMVVFVLPGIMLAAQWLCALGTGADPKKASHPKKIVQLVFWIIPALTIVLLTLTYMTAMGQPVRMEVVMPIIIGLVITIAGNYLPKCKQNYTIGIKIPWTLNNEENWNKTHRFSGWLWTLGGIAMMFTGFFGSIWPLLGITFVIAFVPMIYSYILHRNGL